MLLPCTSFCPTNVIAIHLMTCSNTIWSNWGERCRPAGLQVLRQDRACASTERCPSPRLNLCHSGFIHKLFMCVGSKPAGSVSAGFTLLWRKGS